jgi:hypothetical protein
MISPPAPRIAAVIHHPGHGTDDLVAGFAVAQINRGRRVRGLVQEMHEARDGCRFMLVDLSTGKLYEISQNLVPFSAACRLDSGGLAEASIVLRRIVAEGAELAVVSRYAGLEAKGGGLHGELLALLATGIPTLVVVPERHLAARRHFTGGLADELPARREALENWFMAGSAMPSDIGRSRPDYPTHAFREHA